MSARGIEIVGLGNALGGVAFAFFTGWLLYVATLELQLPRDATFILLNGIAIGVVTGGFLGTLYVGLQEQQATLRRRNRELRRQNDRLDQFASIVSHDLRNPLNVAQGRLELAAETGEESHFDALGRALDRIDSILTDMLAFARQGRTVEDVESVTLEGLATGAWEAVETGSVTLDVEGSFAFEAHESRLSQALENLFRNAVEHGGDDLGTVWVGPLDGERGFYVEDDGRGIPEADREKVFDSGFSTTTEGTGFGLPIVKAVIEAHGWSMEIEAGRTGGARFEVRGLD
jgi:signal transduction histidine kinase